MPILDSDQMVDRPEPTLTGLVLNEKYALQTRIGRGGMGEVYRAEQLSTGGRVAVKVMSTSNRPQKTIDRFRHEAEATAQLTHPNTVRLLDFGADQDVFYLVMEFLQGTDLTRFLRPGGQSPAFVSHVLFQIVCSLTEAHNRGLVHRDIKPNNIMLIHHVGHPSFVKVIDFGIARAIGGPGLGTMGILGTIGYIAPEQTNGEAEPDARTDLYALGCLAYELLTGQLPFEGITHQSAPLDILEAHQRGNPIPITRVRPGLDPELSELVMALIHRDPEERPRSAGELVVPLHRIRSRASDGMAYSMDVPRATHEANTPVNSSAFAMTDLHWVGQTIAHDDRDTAEADAIPSVSRQRVHDDESLPPVSEGIPSPLNPSEKPAPADHEAFSSPHPESAEWDLGDSMKDLGRRERSGNTHAMTLPLMIFGLSLLAILVYLSLR